MKTFGIVVLMWVIGFALTAGVCFTIAGLIYLISTGQWVLAILLFAAFMATVAVVTQ